MNAHELIGDFTHHNPSIISMTWKLTSTYTKKPRRADFYPSIGLTGSAFNMYEASDQDNIIRFTLTFGWDEVGTLPELLALYNQDPEIAYSSSIPVVTDGDGLLSHLTGQDLWFRFTKPQDFSAEAITRTASGLILGKLAEGLPLSDIGREVARIALKVAEDIAWETVLAEEVQNGLALRMDDPEGDVDMSLWVDDTMVLGTSEGTSIPSSMFGEYFGDLPTELMVLDPDQLPGHDVRIMLQADEVDGCESLGFSLRSFANGVEVCSGGQDLLVTEASTVEYVINADTMEVVMTAESGIIQVANEIEIMNLQRGIENSLDVKLENAMNALIALNSENREDATKKLTALLNEIEAQRGIHLADQQADELVAKIEQIIDLLRDH
jgi:hypothetical protein